MVEQGHRAVMVYLVQREDGESMSFAVDLDPNYAQAFEDATNRGVEAIAYECHLTTEEITVTKSLPIMPKLA